MARPKVEVEEESGVLDITNAIQQLKGALLFITPT